MATTPDEIVIDDTEYEGVPVATGIYTRWWNNVGRRACENTAAINQVWQRAQNDFYGCCGSGKNDRAELQKFIDKLDKGLANVPPPIMTKEQYLESCAKGAKGGRVYDESFVWTMESVVIRGIELGPARLRILPHGGLQAKFKRFHPHCYHSGGNHWGDFCLGSGGPELHRLLQYGNLAGARRFVERQMCQYTRSTAHGPLESDQCPNCRALRDLNEPANTKYNPEVTCPECKSFTGCRSCIPAGKCPSCRGACAVCGLTSTTMKKHKVCPYCNVAYVEKLMVELLEAKPSLAKATYYSGAVGFQKNLAQYMPDSPPHRATRRSLGAYVYQCITDEVSDVDKTAIYKRCLQSVAKTVPTE